MFSYPHDAYRSYRSFPSIPITQFLPLAFDAVAIHRPSGFRHRAQRSSRPEANQRTGSVRNRLDSRGPPSPRGMSLSLWIRIFLRSCFQTFIFSHFWPCLFLETARERVLWTPQTPVFPGVRCPLTRLPRISRAFFELPFRIMETGPTGGLPHALPRSQPPTLLRDLCPSPQ